ncbi:MAG: hypothetical protein C0459_09140 [Chitinophaga sp.]|jgi:hypothetical protein|nr:hypothetical protein [Chitinophaga sp.]
MKKIITLATVFTVFLLTNKTQGQIRVGIGVHIGVPVAPVVAQPYYDDNYYYYPDWDVYYNIGLRQYVYFDGYNWIRCNQLPYAYRSCDFGRARYVRINECNPYLRADYYRNTYGYRPQQVYVNRGYNDYDRSRNIGYERRDYDRGRGWGEERHEEHERFERGEGWGRRGH